MRRCEPKYRLAGLAAVLSAVLLVPFGSHAAMQSCPSDDKAAAVEPNPEALAAPEADYIRLHWQVVAPPLYRELPLDTELRSQGVQHLETTRPAYRGESSRNAPADTGERQALKVACAQLETISIY